MIVIKVYGLPQPGGSKSAYVPTDKWGKPYISKKTGRMIVNVVDANKNAPTWKRLVREAAKNALPPDWKLLEGAIEVTMMFFMPRPKFHYGTGKNSESIKLSSPKHHIVKPDVLKLARSTEDALTKVVWKDDAANVDLHICKRYGTPARCEIYIEPLR